MSWDCLYTDTPITFPTPWTKTLSFVVTTCILTTIIGLSDWCVVFSSGKPSVSEVCELAYRFWEQYTVKRMSIMYWLWIYRWINVFLTFIIVAEWRSRANQHCRFIRRLWIYWEWLFGQWKLPQVHVFSTRFRRCPRVLFVDARPRGGGHVGLWRRRERQKLQLQTLPR